MGLSLKVHQNRCGRKLEALLAEALPLRLRLWMAVAPPQGAVVAPLGRSLALARWTLAARCC